jgi:hypothetical protein
MPIEMLRSIAAQYTNKHAFSMPELINECNRLMQINAADEYPLMREYSRQCIELIREEILNRRYAAKMAA